jgi:O-antigen ligase
MPSNGTHSLAARSQRLSLLEFAAASHAVLYIVFSSWALGGNSWWFSTPLCLFGSLALPITLAALFSRSGKTAKTLFPLLAFAVLNLLAISSTFNLNHKALQIGGVPFLLRGGDIRWLPSTTLSADTLSSLWWFDCIFLCAFNVYLILGSRKSVRTITFILVINALALSVFGTLQKFMGATGLFFGVVKSPNTYFFSTFLYHNHWGAFVVSMIAASLGLAWYLARRGEGAYRDFWHSPAFLMLLAVFFLTATLPLSSSRACSLLVVVLLGLAFLHWAFRLIRKRHIRHESIAFQALGAALVIFSASAAIYWGAKPMMEERYRKTLTQVGGMIDNREFSEGRNLLYRDVLRMISERPIFGWGMGSFPHAFYSFNTQDRIRRIHPSIYQDAHSDWLQCLAEHGIVGSLLIAVLALVPLAYSYRDILQSYYSRYVLLGCALILLLALIEFPFGNPAVQLQWWTCFFLGVKYPTLLA